MQHQHWEDRVSKNQYKAIEDALENLRSGARSKVGEQLCYDTLTNNGMSPEEADEMINLILE